MKSKINNIIKKMELQKYIVVRVTKTEFELNNGDIYPHAFDLDEDITVEEFQKLLDDSKEFILKHIENINE